MTTSPFEAESGVDWHVMLDIETMSLHKWNALILSVGMIKFDPTRTAGMFMHQDTQLIVPSIEQQLHLGRHVSPSTQEFWRRQPRDASAHWMNYAGERRSLSGMLHDVRTFCKDASRVWANGTQFDLTNLEGLAEQLGDNGGGELWHYQAPRDMRTFMRETPKTRLMPMSLIIPGNAHEPVYDCVVQAWQVWEHWNEG